MYVLGFMFSPDKKEVLLIRKNRPEWQAGKWNGIGGKIEFSESPRDTIEREFLEETGVRCPKWDCFGEIYGDGFRVFLYRAFSEQFSMAYTVTDEEVRRFFVDELYENGFDDMISNLKIVIPTALQENIKELVLRY